MSATERQLLEAIDAKLEMVLAIMSIQGKDTETQIATLRGRGCDWKTVGVCRTDRRRSADDRSANEGWSQGKEEGVGHMPERKSKKNKDPTVRELEAIKRLLILQHLKAGTKASEVAKAIGMDAGDFSKMMPARAFTKQTSRSG